MKLKKILTIGILSLSLLSLIGCNKKESEKDLDIKTEIETTDNDREILDKYKDGLDIETNLIEEPKTEKEIYMENNKDLISKEEIIIQEEMSKENQSIENTIEEEKEEFIQTETFEQIDSKEGLIIDFSEPNKPLFNVNNFIISSLSYGHEDENGYLTLDLYEKDILINSYSEYITILDELNLFTMFSDEKEDIEVLMNNLSKYDEDYFKNNSLYFYATNNSFLGLDYKGEFSEQNMETGKTDWTFKYIYDENAIINGFMQTFVLIDMDKNIANNVGELKVDISGNF